MDYFTTFLVAFLLIVLVALAILIWKVSRIEKEQKIPLEPQSLLLMQQQLSQLHQDVNGKLSETNQVFREQQVSVTGVVRDIIERMTKVEEVSRQVLNETTELQKLQDILKNPKQRGVLGEFFLENLLKNVLPPGHFQMQYKFRDGEIVDAVVFIKDKIVPIDSKFSLENYNRIAVEDNPAEREKLEKLFVNDLKDRVKETSKYIRPEEGTMDFAFMFIPHEAIYYDLLINKIGVIGEETENIIQRASSKYKVIVVSPTSFLAYLQTVLQGLRAMQIEEQAKEIRLRVADLGKHLMAYETYFKKVGSNLNTTVNQYNLAGKEYSKIDKDVYRLTGETNGFQVEQIPGPDIME
ncbi:MAG: DNA recombination protein RmuC [Patescibacteria group bacterium]